MALVERVKQILTDPSAEWPRIEAESTTTRELYTGYILPLSAIGPVAMVIGLGLFGISMPLAGTVRLPLSQLLTQAIVAYGFGLVSVYVLAWIINMLAPTFGGTKNMEQALKVAAYGATASWVGGLCQLLPSLSLLGLLAALYSLYLVWLGLPVLMKAPSEKSLGYTATVVVAAIVLFATTGVVSASLVATPVALVGGGAEKAGSKQLEEAAKQLESLGLQPEAAKQLEEAAKQADALMKNPELLKQLEDSAKKMESLGKALEEQAERAGQAPGAADSGASTEGR